MDRPNPFENWKGLLRRLPASVANSLEVSQCDRELLQHIGLPEQTDLEVKFHYGDGSAPRLQEWLPYQRGGRVSADHRLRLIGDDYGSWLCIDEEHGGRVVAVVDAATPFIRFMNSTVCALAECLVVLREIRTAIATGTERAPGEWANTLRQQISVIDRAALADPEAWWALVAEDWETNYE